MFAQAKVAHVAARHTHSLGLAINCSVIPVVGERTHGTSFRVLKVTSQVATTGGGVCSL